MEWLETLKGMFSAEKVVAQGIKVVATIVVSWVLYMVLRRLIQGAACAAGARIDEEAHRQRATTLVLLAGSVLKYAIIFVAGIMILRQMGLDPTPILAGAGVVGLAVGFGAQNLVRDVVSGFFIIMEGQYAVGDLVEINGTFGRVEEVGLRVTRIRDATGQLCFFPNGSIRTANNYTEDYVSYFATIPVAQDQGKLVIPIVAGILADFDEEFRVFVAPPAIEAQDMPSSSQVVRVKARAIPGRHGIIEQKLPGRLTAGLNRAGHPMAEGMEVGISLQYPSPGTEVVRNE